MKILITDVFLRKTFDVVNIIKLHYKSEDLIFGVEKKYLPEKLFAKILYEAKHVHLLRKDRNYFKSDLQKISENFKEEEITYIPIEEDTTLEFYNYLKSFPRNNFKYKLPSLSTYLLSRNKEELNIFCQENEINCPKYIKIEDFEKGDFKLPVILKPKIGSGAKGIEYIDNEAQLKELQSRKINFEEFFIQEKILDTKNVIGGFYLCQKGEVKSYYSHKRIRTYPESGGVTVFSQTVYEEKIKDLGAKIINKLNWDGILMIEFLLDPVTREYKVIEINPRLWGSILLSEFNGSNFIKQYLSEEEKAIPSFYGNLNVNTYVRWIFPYDFFYWIKNRFIPIDYFKKSSDTCYMNFTYSSIYKALIFIMMQLISKKNIKKFVIK